MVLKNFVFIQKKTTSIHMDTIKNVILVEINIFFLSVSAVYHYLKYIIFEKSPVTCDIQYS